MTDLAARTQMQIIHVDYPLAPEHPYPEATEALYDVYQSLLVQGIQPKDIILSGDSCGANLALALCLRLKEQPELMPSGLILMSPFLDLTLTSESLRFNQNMMPYFLLKLFRSVFNIILAIILRQMTRVFHLFSIT